MRIWARRYVVSLLILAALSDLLGGAATHVFNAAATPGAIALCALPLLLAWALMIGLLGHRGICSTN